MPAVLSFTVTAILQTLENDLLVGEALFFPAFSRVSERRSTLLSAITAEVRERLPREAPGTLHTRRAPTRVDTATVEVSLPPPREGKAWRAPLSLTFHVVHYANADDSTAIAYVPSLGIEVVGATRQEVDAAMPGEVLGELMRRRASISLAPLLWLQRVRALEVVREVVEIALPTLKERARTDHAAPRREPLLPRIATSLDKHPRQLYEIDPTPLARALSTAAGKAVLLVGPSGAGKTALTHQLAARKADFGYGSTPFWETSGARIMAGGGGIGAWQERCEEMWREAVSTRAVLLLGSLAELIEVGRHATSPQGIAGYLRSYIARGDVALVVECTAEQYGAIERADGPLLSLFRRLDIEPPDDDRLHEILSSAAIDATVDSATTIEAPAIASIALLHARFATASAPPGRPLRFLRNLARDAVAAIQARVTASDVARAFAHETGLPPFLIDSILAFEVDEARDWFATRVQGQPEPIEHVVDVLATVKAALTRPHRPLGAFLFIGPTGVGKTEMARCLAEFLFHDRARMVRFDMSEYADGDAVRRLIGTPWGAQGLLTAAVREQPFCVVLLDEVEKAHPAFFDLLLQVLGEARLTDAAGRLADFRNAVVIMTSNLGAAGWQGTPLGLIGDADRDRSPADAARAHFVAAVRAQLRPELFNRIDRIVPFAPLDRATILALARREVAAVCTRDGVLGREVEIEIDDAVYGWLALRGYDARYGARPLKRAIERDILAPLATALNRYGDEIPLGADVRLRDGALRVEVKPRAAGVLRRHDSRAIAQTERLSALRRRAGRLQTCPSFLELQSERYRLERPSKRWRSEADRARHEAHLKALRALIERVDALATDLAAAEDGAMLALFTRDADAPAFDGVALARRLDDALLDVYAWQFQAPVLTLALYASAASALHEQADIYLALLEERRLSYRLAALVPPRDKDSSGRILDTTDEWSRLLVEDATRFMRDQRGDLFGLLIETGGGHAFALLEPEGGQHVIVHPPSRTERMRVIVARHPLEKYAPPPQVTRRHVLDNIEKRRTVWLGDDRVDDARLGRSKVGERSYAGVVRDAVLGAASRAIDAMLEGEVSE